jgi:hypothetical protein
MNNNSLNKLGNYIGYSSPNIIDGATYNKINHYSPPYEFRIKKWRPVPWLGQHQERTFMSRIKYDSDNVKDYEEYKLKPIPNDNHNQYHSNHYNHSNHVYYEEGFGPELSYISNFIWNILALVLILSVIYFIINL